MHPTPYVFLSVEVYHPNTESCLKALRVMAFSRVKKTLTIFPFLLEKDLSEGISLRPPSQNELLHGKERNFVNMQNPFTGI